MKINDHFRASPFFCTWKEHPEGSAAVSWNPGLTVTLFPCRGLDWLCMEAVPSAIARCPPVSADIFSMSVPLPGELSSTEHQQEYI